MTIKSKSSDIFKLAFKLEEQVKRLIKTNLYLLDLLDKVEWESIQIDASGNFLTTVRCCPICKNKQTIGHATDCPFFKK